MIKFKKLDCRNLWLTSDTHYSHKNICRGTSGWEHGNTRDFDTLEEMNDSIIEGINSKVGKDDILIHHGDVSFQGINSFFEFEGRVRCKDIIYIEGNHDHLHASKSWRQIGYFSYMGKIIVSCHYPLAAWHQHHKGALHSFGHVHGSYEGIGKSYDVGVDSAYKLFNEYRPFSFNEFVEITNRKEIQKLSHHDKHIN